VPKAIRRWRPHENIDDRPPVEDDTPSPGSQRRPALDEADRNLIALLTDDGRLSNRALATAIGLTEPTISARLRSLYERRILCVTATLDWLAAGYRWDAWLHITVEGRPVKEAAQELAAVEGIRQVSVVFGPSDLVALLIVRDESEAVNLITDQIGRIPGLKSVRPHVIL
jgi:DNA-binding Lrp family transcriptional regulator